MRRRSRLAFLFLLVSAAGFAQKAEVVAPGGLVAATPVVAWPRVSLNVAVLDRNDEPAKGILPAQLTLEEDGQDVSNFTLVPDTAPQSVCLLVDSSGSTYYQRAAILAELKQLIDALPPEDELCGVDFSAEAYMDAPLGSDRAAMTKWTTYIRSAGGTALLDAVNAVSRMMMGRARYPSRAIILISDGGENASKTTEMAAIQTLHTLGAPTMYVLENPGAERADRNLLQKMTAATGGLEFPIRRDADRQPAVERLLAAMSGRYRMEFTSPDPVENATDRKLRVQLNKELRKQRMNIAAPDAYIAAGRR